MFSTANLRPLPPIPGFMLSPRPIPHQGRGEGKSTMPVHTAPACPAACAFPPPDLPHRCARFSHLNSPQNAPACLSSKPSLSLDHEIHSRHFLACPRSRARWFFCRTRDTTPNGKSTFFSSTHFFATAADGSKLFRFPLDLGIALQQIFQPYCGPTLSTIRARSLGAVAENQRPHGAHATVAAAGRFPPARGI